jgi:hypothetical protein
MMLSRIGREWLAVALLAAAGCSDRGAGPSPSATPASSPAPTSGEAAWLMRGTTDERFERVAKHLRGFDVAMVETGHRYVELYWAGRDRNWGYAEYQLQKMKTVIANGLERRPKRAESAGVIEEPLSDLASAIERRDPAELDRAFAVLTETCNACHRAERVPFVAVQPPVQRSSPVGPTQDELAHRHAAR